MLNGKIIFECVLARSVNGVRRFVSIFETRRKLDRLHRHFRERLKTNYGPASKDIGKISQEGVSGRSVGLCCEGVFPN